MIYIILVYCIAQVALGLWLGRKVRSSGDFFVAGRSLSPGLLFATLLAANVGAGSTVGATGLGYRNGIAAWWWVGSAAIGSFVLAFWVGPVMRRLAARLELNTVGDYLEHRYGVAVRATLATLLSLGSISILAGQIIALAWLLNVVAGVSKPLGCLLGGLTVTAYFSAGGLLTSVWLNVLQLVVKLVGLGTALVVLLVQLGDWHSVLAVRAADPGYWSFWHNGASGWPYLVLLGPAFVVSPGLLQKIYGARDDTAVRRGAGGNAIALFLYAGVPPLLGILAAARFPDLASPELALPTLLARGVPPLVGSLGLAAVFSAEVSAADAVLFMLSTSLSQDFYRRFVDPGSSATRLLSVARGLAAAAGVAAILLAVLVPTVIDALAIFYTLITVSLFVPVVGGLLLPRAGTPEALSAVGAGLGGALLAHVAGGGPTGILTPALAGTVASALAFAAVRLARAHRTGEER
jgi:solute:Na+ symporter, SSS family